MSVSECACVFQRLKCQIKTNVSHHGVSLVEMELTCSWRLGELKGLFKCFEFLLRVLASKRGFKAYYIILDTYIAGKVPTLMMGE